MSTTRIWLTAQTYDELRAELRDLLRQRSEAPVADRERNDPPGSDAEAREREQRIRRLQELLRDPVVGDRPPDDGVAEPGMAVTVRYDDGETETFLLSHEEGRAGAMMVCSPDSPLGRALQDAREGDQVRYTLPDGGTAGCTLLRVVPYTG
ncbi:GreA/GreB family elongation factor [Pseudonocardia sp. C8]|uniref:GreA/GreB family elongation factor n=1 Tax=Pseudonocardia sp. C8 TaxID=2762759 RepID=UPI001642A078|nr:GreA/GreB family elongation factor [Pseudonocardia sp. C8]MBC3192730.1 GreA/GreB family elongation factor [Pseudonocardia sp. C8]